MFYPELLDPGMHRMQLTEFGGLNGQAVVPPGQFAYMENLTGQNWPALSTRPARNRIDTWEDVPVGDCCLLHWKDGLLWLDYDGTLHAGPHTLEHFAEPRDGRTHRLVSMGAFVCVFPDKNWCNAVKLAAGQLTDSDHGAMEYSFTTDNAIALTNCTPDGTPYTPLVAVGRPAEPANGDYWLDISLQPPVMRRWSEADRTWQTESMPCVRLSCAGIGAGFRLGDTVRLTDFIADWDSPLQAEAVAQLQAQPRTVRALDRDYVVVDGLVAGPCQLPSYWVRLTAEITAQTDAYTGEQLAQMTESELEQVLETLPERAVYRPRLGQWIPDMDYVVECGNRLWGCRYDGQVNEIYASCLGDFTNWWRFDGVASDAYRVSRGADGPFTGAAVLNGTVLFFRSQWVEKVFPAADGAHQVVTTALDGVAPGCADSLQQLDGVLYYLSGNGVMAYDGSLPVCVSRQLRDVPCSEAVGGRWGSRYYLSCRTDRGEHLLVYDTVRRFWHREDNTMWRCSCVGTDDLYYVNDSGQLFCVGGTAGAPESRFTWIARTGILGQERPDGQYTGRVDLRLRLGTGSRIRVLVRYDDDAEWELCAQLIGAREPMVTLPLRLRRCAQLQLQLEGEGPVVLFSLTRCFTDASER